MAESAVRVRLVVTDGAGQSGPAQVVTLPIDLGRDPARVDVAVTDPAIADRHARLESDGDRVAVVDLRTGRRSLVADDVVSLGSSTLGCSVVPPAPRPGVRPAPPTRPVPPARAAATFGTAWAVARDGDTLTPVPLRGLYTAWGRTTRSAAALGGLLAVEPAGPVARLDAHDALDTALTDFLGGDLLRLGNLTVAFCRPDRPVDVVSRHVLRLRGLPAYRKSRTGSIALRAALDGSEEDTTADGPVRATALLALEDRRCLVRTVTALRQGAALFQRHGVAVIDQAGDDLLEHLKTVLGTAALRDLRVMAHLRLAGLIPDDPADDLRQEPEDLS